MSTPMPTLKLARRDSEGQRFSGCIRYAIPIARLVRGVDFVITFESSFKNVPSVKITLCGECRIGALLVHDNRHMVVPLYIIGEDVKTSEEPFYNLCRCTGWSNHFVSKRKYHMIIPVDDEWHKPLVNGILDLPTHRLHGLIHCNGFAHLVCINGLEEGSKHLYGREIMDLWDRICTNLRTRKSPLRMPLRNVQWIYAFSMVLLMGILGLVGGVTSSAIAVLV